MSGLFFVSVGKKWNLEMTDNQLVGNLLTLINIWGVIKNERLQIDRYEFLDLCTGIKKEHELIDAIDPVLIDNPQNIKNTIKKRKDQGYEV